MLTLILIASLCALAWGVWYGPIFHGYLYLGENLQIFNHRMFLLTAISATLGILGILFYLEALKGGTPRIF